MRERNANVDAIAGMLPLLPATFHILVALADEDRHGYAIIRDVAARSDGSIRLSPGTLYRSIQRMLELSHDQTHRTRPHRQRGPLAAGRRGDASAALPTRVDRQARAPQRHGKVGHAAR